VVVLFNHGGRSEIVVLDLENGTPASTPALPAEVVEEMVTGPQGDTLALVLTGANSPSDIWTLDLEGGRLEQVTFSPHAGVSLAELVHPKPVQWVARDGVELDGWLYLPSETDGPFPVVISLHGGPEAQERPRLDGVYQSLVENGVAVIAPNVRGSSGRGPAFAALDDGELRIGAVRDVGATIDFLVDSGVGDPDRIGVIGWSYGGYLALAALARQPERFAAAGIISGFADFEVFFEHTASWRSKAALLEYGDPERDLEMLRKISPISSVSRIQAPTLLIHGARDRNVPASEAERVVEVLRSHQCRAELLLFPEEGHHFLNPQNRVRTSTALVRWMLDHLE